MSATLQERTNHRLELGLFELAPETISGRYVRIVVTPLFSGTQRTTEPFVALSESSLCHL